MENGARIVPTSACALTKPLAIHTTANALAREAGPVSIARTSVRITDMVRIAKRSAGVRTEVAAITFLGNATALLDSLGHCEF